MTRYEGLDAVVGGQDVCIEFTRVIKWDRYGTDYTDTAKGISVESYTDTGMIPWPAWDDLSPEHKTEVQAVIEDYLNDPANMPLDDYEPDPDRGRDDFYDPETNPYGF